MVSHCAINKYLINKPNWFYFYILEKEKGSQLSLMFLLSKDDVNFLKPQALVSCLPIACTWAWDVGTLGGSSANAPERSRATEQDVDS